MKKSNLLVLCLSLFFIGVTVYSTGELIEKMGNLLLAIGDKKIY